MDDPPGDHPEDQAATDPLIVLAITLDEMRETATLLPVAEAGRSMRRPWWRNVLYGFARSRTEVTAGLAVQYLGENIDRARDHWREALSNLRQLRVQQPGNDMVDALLADLDRAGLNEVLPRLQHDAIPSPISKTALHLEGIVTTIRDCDHIVTTARSKLLLQRMRHE